MAAPTRLESTAWLDDVGRPKYQVIRSQIIAATSADKTVSWVTLPVSTNPAPTVFATAVPDAAPTRLSIVAIMIAFLGESTRVETQVAIALAVSWNPLIKSKITARTTTQTSRTKESCIFKDYRL
jgi:hypothetical protein